MPKTARQDSTLNERIPSNLAGHATLTTHDFGRTLALHSSNGGTKFELWHNGTIFEQYELLVRTDDEPVIIIAKATDTGEEITVFDGGKHGYDNMFVDEHDQTILNARNPNILYERNGHTVFELEVALFDNIDWDDEEDDYRGEDGVIRLITGEEISPDRLRADGYDAFGITVISPDGERHDAVSEELA